MRFIVVILAFVVAIAACGDSRLGEAPSRSTALDLIWTTTRSLAVARSHHTATLLLDGRIWIAGGNASDAQGTTELFDRRTGTFTSGPKSTPRVDHTATILRTGEVLLAGGTLPSGQSTTSTELYDPDTGTSTPGPVMASPRTRHTATMLDDGRVLLAGGTSAASQAEIYDPATKKLSITGTLLVARSGHTATRLDATTVLFVGGTAAGVSSSAEVFDAGTGQFRTADGLLTSRIGHTATLLPSGDVLVAGGRSTQTGLLLIDAELYRPSTGDVTTSPMTEKREGHTALLMPSGNVLIAGGASSTGQTSATLEELDIATSMFSPKPETLAQARAAFTATLVPGGDVVFIGGTSSPVPPAKTLLQSVELYTADVGGPVSSMAQLLTKATEPRVARLPDGSIVVSGGTTEPSTGLDVYEWQSDTFVDRHKDMLVSRLAHTATLLGNGKVLFAGGTDRGIGVDSAELFDRESITATGKMLAPRSSHAAVRLPTGKVLIVGGIGPKAQTAELYDPATGTFSATGTMTVRRASPTATLLATGEVLVTGGEDPTVHPIATAETFDIVTGLFTATGPMSLPRASHAATLLASGEVLVAGGASSKVAELYDPITRKFRATSGQMTSARSGLSATLLPSGKVLLLGGVFLNGSSVLDELYDPAIDRFFTTSSFTSSIGHAAVLLESGDVFVAGGFGQLAPQGKTGVSLWRPVALTGDESRVPGLSPIPSGATAGSSWTISGKLLTEVHSPNGATAPISLWMPSNGGLLSGVLRPTAMTPAAWSVPPTTLTGPGLFFVSIDGIISNATFVDVGPGHLGGACTRDLDCASSHCVDGVCCNTACQGVCMACSPKKLGGETGGMCRPIPMKTDPDGECPAQPVATCGRAGGCDGAGACTKLADHTTCGPASECAKGACTPVPVIGCVNDSASRDAQGSLHACAPFRCRDSGCLARCTSSADCASGYQCSASGDCLSPLDASPPDVGCVCALGGPNRARERGRFAALTFALLACCAFSARRASRSRSGPARTSGARQSRGPVGPAARSAHAHSRPDPRLLGGVTRHIGAAPQHAPSDTRCSRR